MALIILGCSYYFELLSGCALMVLLAAALNPTTPHRTLPSHAGRYCARILSDRQFEYLPSWKYCVVSFSSNYQTRVFLFHGFVSCFFHAHRCCSIDSWVAVAITLHLISLILAGRFYARFSSFGMSRISFGDIVLFSSFSRTFRTRVPFVSF